MSENVAADQLREFIERIERLEDERLGVYDDLRANGYNAKTVRKVIKLRRLENFERQEADALLDTYRNALGLV